MNQRHLRKCWTILICVPLIGLFLFGLPSAVFSQSTPAHIYIEPAVSNALTCDTHEIQVMVENVVDLTAYHLEISFDPNVVEVLEVVNGEFLAEPDDVDYFYEPSNDIDNVNGLISFGMAQQGVETEPGVEPQSGSGSLIVITLKALVPNASTIFHIDAAMSNLVEWPSAFEIDFTATDGSVSTESCPPTEILLSNATVAENLPIGTLVGQLSSVDADPDDDFSYSLKDAGTYPDNLYFSMDGNQLNTASVFNYELKSSYTINVRSTDLGGSTFDKTFTVNITDVNDPPVAYSQEVVTTEDHPVSFTIAGFDEDGDDFEFVLVSSPDHGSLPWTPPNLTYTPDFGFEGLDSFEFKLVDEHDLAGNLATVNITVNPKPETLYYFPIFFNQAGN